MSGTDQRTRRAENKEDFGLIRPSLLRQLRGILDQYPDDGQILKELLQNAEDARATEVKFLYDQHCYGTDPDKLYHPGLAQFQGPALYAFNNGLFDESDWKGIRMLQDSVKEKDPMKVGRFGLGFKSVLHLTDLPSVLSGDRVAMIDPHEKFFTFEGSSTTGYSWQLGQQQAHADLINIPHQFDPYVGLFGCNIAALQHGFFDGTLFRFPLRNQPSPLSDTVYNEEKMNSLFQSFKADANLLLLFLRSLERVELYTRTAAQPSPLLTFRVQVADHCVDFVRAKRKEFSRQINHEIWLDRPVTVTYPLVIETCEYINGSPVSENHYEWLVTAYYAGGEASMHLKNLKKDPLLSNIPLVGVAMSTNPVQEETIDANEEGDIAFTPPEEDRNAPTGHVFCFLPLPIEQKSSTGLPVHVNGYFSISQNRRHLKWPTAGQNVHGDKLLLWNHCLLKEVIPKAYVELVESAINMHKRSQRLSPEIIYSALPNLVHVDDKWHTFLEPFYQELFKRPFLHTARSNRWIYVDDALFDCMKEDGETQILISECLIQAGVNVVKPPLHILHALGAYSSMSPDVVCPMFTRDKLKEHPEVYVCLGNDQKNRLLKYLLKDQDFRDMEGLKLLPLADGSYATFLSSGQQGHIYIASKEHPKDLFPGLDSIFVSEELCEDTLKKLSSAADEEKSQLVHVTKEVTPVLLPRVVPSDWFNEDQVTWFPGNKSKRHPPKAWMECLWSYIQREFPDDLYIFQGMPFLQLDDSENPKLAPMRHPSTLVMKSALGATMSDNVASVLVKAGLGVVEDLGPSRSHPLVIGNFVRLPVAVDVLDALVEIANRRGEAYVTNAIKLQASDECKRDFRAFLAKVEPMLITVEQERLLAKLPIFETVEGSGSVPSQFVSLKDVTRAAPEEQVGLPYIAEQLLDLSSDDSKALAKLFDIAPMKMSHFLEEIVFPHISQDLYSGEDVQNLMSRVLTHLPLYLNQNPKFKDKLRNLPFVTTASGKSCAPTALYDPGSPFLQVLFIDQDVFPVGRYASLETLSILRQLGLRGEKSVVAADLLSSADYLARVEMTEDNHDKLCKKSRSMMEYLCKNPHLLVQEVQGKHLQDWLYCIRWIACAEERPRMYPDSLPWSGNLNQLHKPSEITSHQWSIVCGSQMPISQIDPSVDVSSAFGWDVAPTIYTIIAHLKNVTQYYNPGEKARYMAVITSIYDQLNQAGAYEVSVALQDQQLSDWVWHGEGFTTPGNIVLQRPFIELYPYFYRLPSEIQRYKDLFIECGIHENCNERTLIKVLYLMKSKYDGEYSAEQGEVDRDLQLSVDIINHLKVSRNIKVEDLRETILLPIHTDAEDCVKLVPLLDCTYCDVEWLRQGFDLVNFEEDDGLIFIHENIPNSTAEALGVPTLMSRMLHAEEFHITGFGQTEPLTARLKRLLEEYTDGLSLPKEIIQNSDDAEATEVKFLFDERKNEDCMKYLIDEGMRECQGPALWAYNNSVFTDQDFQNITKLGGATKEKETEKIGKFGLGFNAVYNVTDVPSFISRQNIIIFDPHMNHLNRGIKDKTKPGIKIDMQKNKTLLRKLPDQFKPYQNVFGCKIGADESHNYYNGTLFRFPLRTRAQATRSEISNRHYDERQVQELLRLLQKSAKHLLLFTQNVLKVTVYHLPADASDPAEAIEVFSVEKSPVKIIRDMPTNVSVPPAAREMTYQQRQLLKNSSILKAATSFMQRMRTIGPRRQSLGDTRIKGAPSASVIINVMFHISDHGKQFLQTCASDDTQAWLTSSCMGSGPSLSQCLSLDEDGYIPTAGVAVPVEDVDGGYVAAPLSAVSSQGTGMVFCYLPLPTRSGLPVHVNGMFAVQSNRRQLCERTEDDKYSSRVEWNEVLLEDGVCEAYAMMLYDLHGLWPRGSQFKFIDLWPQPRTTLPVLKKLVEGFYQHVGNSDRMPVYSTEDRVVTFGKTVFLDPTLGCVPDIGSAALDVFKACMGGQDIIDLPREVVEGFSSIGMAGTIAAKTYDTTRFFGEILFPQISKLDASLRDPLILYALDATGMEDLDLLICNFRCIPSSPDGSVLKRPDELVHPSSIIAKLYSEEDNKFPYGRETYATPSRLRSLQRLGMQSNDIAWADITERAQSIKTLYQEKPDEAKQRLAQLLNFMDRKLSRQKELQKSGGGDGESTDSVAELMKIEFLPLLPKPQDFPMPWKGDEYASGTLMAPPDLQLKEHRFLVCSTQPLFDDSFKGYEVMTPQVKQYLGLTGKDIPAPHVITQFGHALNVPLAALEEQKSLDQVRKVCFHIYSYLEKECKDDDDFKRYIKGAFNEKQCVLVHNRFLEPKQVAKTFSQDCAPYLYGLPADMAARFPGLMQVFGVRESFEVRDYMDVMNDLEKSYHNQALEGKQLNVALRVVSLLNKQMKASKMAAEEVEEWYGTIYIPDIIGILKPSSALCYNDCPWLSESQNMNFTHPEITYQVSAHLGVKTKRQEALSRHAKGIPFGQKERLTNGLKRILNTYPCDHEILKELTQNADDAQATCIHFINDARQHADKHIFENCWKPLQGPALCVYNNRPFTKSDLEGIQRLGEGSKTADPNKTGQYGVGFSSVYHLTDAPSLLSHGQELDETLCVFDPHCLYVPGATPSEPGMRYDDLQSLKADFPDVFQCYLPDMFPMDNATLFRFPLRTKAMAQKSEISNSQVSVSKLQNIMEKFKKEMFEILLFVKSVEEISLSDVDVQTDKLCNTYTVKAHISQEDRLARTEFGNYVRDMTEKLRNREVSIKDIKKRDITYTLIVKDNCEMQEKWCITQSIGFDDETEVPESVKHAFMSGELALLPRGGAACLLEKRISGRVEIDSRPRKVFCFLPLPIETDLPVHINGHFALGHENRRHLWTNTDAPGYQKDWNDTVCNEVIAPSLAALLTGLRMHSITSQMEDSVARAHCSRSMLDSALNAFQSYFPTFSDSRPQWNGLVSAFYRYLSGKNVCVLPAVREWFATNDSQTPVPNQWMVAWLPPQGNGEKRAFFDRMDNSTPIEEQASFLGKFKSFFRSTPASTEKTQNDILRETLLACGFNLVQASNTIVDAFKKSKVEVDHLSPENVIMFLRSYSLEEPMCTLGKLPAKLSQTPFKDEKTYRVVVEYCKQDPAFLEKLPGLPLLLTNDNMLRVFDADYPVFASKYFDLLQECGDSFIHRNMKELFTDSSQPETNVLKTFDIECAEQLLHHKLPPDQFKDREDMIEWVKRYNSIPNEPWVRRLWTFICTEIASKTKSQQQNGENETSQEISVVAEKLLAPLMSWSVLPTRSQGKNYLAPLKLSRSVMDFHLCEYKMYGVRDVVKKLGAPELDRIAMNSDQTANADVMRPLVTTLDKPNQVLEVVHRAHTKAVADVKLSKEECNRLLGYFSESINEIQQDGTNCDRLRDLPLYATIYGDIISLTGCVVYTLPAEIPTDDIDVWQSKSGTVFLERNTAFQSLYDFLGCASISVADVYCQFILQHFEYFSPEARLVHLHHIHKKYLSENSTLNESEKEGLQDVLRTLPFIEDGDGNLLPADQFYDPENVVFQIMLPQDKFPPRANHYFRESEWISFLGRLGLIREVSKEMYVGFATTVATEAKDATQAESAITKSRVLVKHLFDRHNVSREDLLDNVCSIPFIAAEPVLRELQDLYPQYGDVGTGKLPYICFKDSISKDYERIAWTKANILPAWADPIKQYHLSYEERVEIAECLQVQKLPNTDTVVSHLQNICDHFMVEDKGATNVGNIALQVEVFRTIYRHLQEYGMDTSQAKTRLDKTPCVLVDNGHNLVCASQTVLNMYDEEEVRPYLYKVPVDLGEFQRLFCYLGATDVATVDQYAAVLTRIRSLSLMDQLTPNELKDTYKAMRGLFSTLEKLESPLGDRDVKTSLLFLPSERGQLMDSTTLMFNDAPSFYYRVKDLNRHFMVDLKECKVRVINAEESIAKLPKKLRPQLLTSYVQENLTESMRRTRSVHGMAEHLQRHLTSDAFTRAIVRLLHHESHRSGARLDDAAMSSVVDRLHNIKVYSVDRVITHLSCQGSYIPGSELETACFVEVSHRELGQDLWNVYICGNADLDQDLLIKLAEVVNQILKGLLRDSVLYILPILACSTDEIESRLDSLNVRVDYLQTRVKRSTMPQPGDPIPESHHRLLKSGSQKFSCGDYAGYSGEESNSQLVYAIIQEQVLSTPEQQMYLIDIGNGKDSVIASGQTLYEFSRK